MIEQNRLSPCFPWQPTIIGSHCQLVPSGWLPSVLQTEDQQKRTDNFVSITCTIGSHGQLVLSDWLLLVLQTKDQQRRTNDFVYIPGPSGKAGLRRRTVTNLTGTATSQIFATGTSSQLMDQSSFNLAQTALPV